MPLRPESLAELTGDLCFPGKLAVSPDGAELTIADSNHDRIVVTTLDGRLVRILSSGERAFADGPTATASFNRPQGLAFHQGALIVADTENRALRRVDLASFEVTTLAGSGALGQHRGGHFEAHEAELNSPWDLVVVDAQVPRPRPRDRGGLDAQAGRRGKLKLLGYWLKFVHTVAIIHPCFAVTSRTL